MNWDALKQDFDRAANAEVLKALDEAIEELYKLRSKYRAKYPVPDGIQQMDEGMYEFDCEKCGEHQWFGDSQRDVDATRHWCMRCIEAELSKLEAGLAEQPTPAKPEASPQEATEPTPVETVPLNDAEIEKLKQEVASLQEELAQEKKKTEHWPDKLNCDQCGDEFEPEHREITWRHAYCSDECQEQYLKEHNVDDHYRELHEGKRKHTALPPDVKDSPAGLAARSEAQQERRQREAATEPIDESEHKDAWHGTTSGYSNHRCRCEECTRAWREYCLPRQKAWRAGKSEPNKQIQCTQCEVWFTPDKSNQKLCSDECRQRRQSEQSAQWAEDNPDWQLRKELIEKSDKKIATLSKRSDAVVNPRLATS